MDRDVHQKKTYYKKSLFIEILFYCVLAIATCVIVKIVFRIPLHSLSTPLSYSGDVYGALLVAHNFIIGGSLFNYPNLGAPFISTDITSVFGLLNYILIYIGSRFSSQPGLIVNLLYLGSYPAIAVTAAFSLRKLKINYAIAAMGGLLYTFLPYHYMRNVWHLFLSLYFIIPLACLICIWFMNGDFFEPDNLVKSGGSWLYRIMHKYNRKMMLFAIIVCVLTAYIYPYYALFFCIILLFVALFSSIERKSVNALLYGVFLSLVIGINFLLQMIPKLLSGESIVTGSLVRQISESQHYSLQILQLILPVDGHNISLLADMKNFFNMNNNIFNENTMSTLGLFMTLGLLISVFTVLFGLAKYRNSLVFKLGSVNLFIILFSTIGGLDMLFSMYLTTVVRCYNRMSIFIAFFSLVVLALLMQHFTDRVDARGKKRIMKSCLVLIPIVIAGIGIYDQVPSWSAVNSTGVSSIENYRHWDLQDYTFPSNEWNNDEKFVKQIESIVHKDSMIYQLPSFGGNRPEYLGDLKKMYAYDIWKPTLHSATLRWSSGRSVDTDSDLWNIYQESLPVDSMIDNLVYAGFDGIYIDSYGYSEEAGAILFKKIEDIVKTKPLISDNGRLYFFSFADYGATLKSGMTVEELAQKNRDALNYTDVYNYPVNCFPKTINDSCSVSGKLIILNTINGSYNSEGYLTSDPKKVGSSPHLLFGPYRPLTTGTYKVEFDIDTSDFGIPDGEVGTVSASALAGTEIFATKSFGKNEGEITIEFTVKEDSENCEISIVTSQANVVFRGYTITKVS